MEGQDCHLTCGFLSSPLFCRKEAITLPENEDTEIEGMLNFSHGRSASMQFQQTSYFAMVKCRNSPGFCTTFTNISGSHEWYNEGIFVNQQQLSARLSLDSV